ncbi:acyltransferase domain-containing protein [Buchnera aphidicola (Thelaxes californica)]|uniref:Malonyl CoA-acyl carrier protein transacylase n=1 Tax=Buchnera aphidicola (Thelaxes californica) TaxID=1315998 RepID=A0A4D6YLF4_9GAMM|nr:acyltransferase domain-containing protein [Buchnera aphidicola]QCI26804.1 acyltransferase domain-containing protein [Buchnera aphidicola (Thelaxes californica)]
MNIVIMFPGQGHYSPKSIYQLNLNFPIIKKTFIEASEYAKVDLWKIIKKNKNKKYHIGTQVLLLTICIAIYKMWNSMSIIHPFLMIGHSLGEYAALVCAKTINFSDAINIVMIREKLMLESTNYTKGRMCAILGLKQKYILKICQTISSKTEIVSIASVNTDNQIIIAGNVNGVMNAIQLCKLYGSSHHIILPIKVASHCILMYKVAKQLKNVISTYVFKKPMYKILNPLSIAYYTDVINIKSALVKHLIYTINWKDCILYLKKKKVSLFLEISSNCILTNINKKIIKTSTISLNHYSNFVQAMNIIMKKKKLH